GGAAVTLARAVGAVDVCVRLVLGRLPVEDLAVLGERDDRRRGARALGVGDDVRLAALEDRDGRVGGAEVDTDCTSHGVLLLSPDTEVWFSGLGSRPESVFPDCPRPEGSVNRS